MENKTRLAVSVVFQFENKLFFTKRQPFLKAFPGYIAFPGGKVEKEESLLETLEREILEELNFSLKNNENVLEIKKIAKATSPSFNPIRFETYFFLVKLANKVDFNPCADEFESVFWLTPNQFFEMHEQGRSLTVTPIRMIVELLKNKIIDFVDLDKEREAIDLPEIENIRGVVQIMPQSNTLPPANRTNLFLIGDEKKVLVDPSPKNEEELDKVLFRIENENIQKIFITHHHGDHHQFAVKISEIKNLPIYISKDSYERIKKKWGESYFRETTIVFAKEGDILTRWLGEDVLCFEIPGHDEGHLGLAPRSMKWFLVGDLFQGVGTVVVGDDEGDMGKYYTSLKRVISLKPACVIPSHGIPLGGSFILQKTLEHRMTREKEIRELAIKGHSPEEILQIIYSFVPDKVKKYALKNIYSHLKKIEDEDLN